MDKQVNSFGYENKVAVLICPAIFQRNFVVTAYVIGHKFCACNGTPPILSRKQRNSVVCKFNTFVQYRSSHEPYHRIGVYTEIFMDFRPSFRCVPVDGFLLVLGVPCLNIPDWNEGVSVQKPKLFTLSIPLLYEAAFQFSLSGQAPQSV